jgi:hypothetical protein
MSIPELAMNPLSPRILHVIRELHNSQDESYSSFFAASRKGQLADEITFADLVRSLSVFHCKASRDQKMQCKHNLRSGSHLILCISHSLAFDFDLCSSFHVSRFPNI